MTKGELFQMMKDMPDDTEIVVWRWTEKGSRYFFTYLAGGKTSENIVLLVAESPATEFAQESWDKQYHCDNISRERDMES